MATEEAIVAALVAPERPLDEATVSLGRLTPERMRDLATVVAGLVVYVMGEQGWSPPAGEVVEEFTAIGRDEDDEWIAVLPEYTRGAAEDYIARHGSYLASRRTTHWDRVVEVTDE